MSIVQSQAVDFPTATTDHHRVSSKRKLDDYASPFGDEDYDSDYSEFLASVRMRREGEALAASSDCEDGSLSCHRSPNHSRLHPCGSPCFDSSSCSSSWEPESEPGPGPAWSNSRIQFFVRMVSGGNSIVVQANPEDTVMSIHERLQLITGIPVMEQRLIYNGRQLQLEHSLVECAIQNDAGLQLVCRMRSTKYPKACQLTNEIVAYVCGLCRTGMSFQMCSLNFVTTLIGEIFKLAPKDNNEEALEFFRVFVSCSGPAALVMLYMSPRAGNKQSADICIRHFLSTCKSLEKNCWQMQCLPVVFEFCKLLRKVTNHDDLLYRSCRSNLASLLDFWFSKYGVGGGGEDIKQLVVVPDLFLFVRELANSLSKDLDLNECSSMVLGPSEDDVSEFAAFLAPLVCAIMTEIGYLFPLSIPLSKRVLKNASYAEEVEQLHIIYIDLLARMDRCLMKMEQFLPCKLNGEGESTWLGWSQHLVLLKELNRISKLYKNAEDGFWGLMRLRKASVRTLIVRYANRTDDHLWLLHDKEITDFQSRRHLALMMFPEVKEDYDELHEMLIDRSHLLAESFEYIARAGRNALHSGLFMEFKNEEATGPGVLREWFFLVVQAIFNQQNALFVACPNDQRRFYPNTASKVDPMHLDYFTFAGRVIALALMHKVQVGIVFDRVFYLQLAGIPIKLEDIQDADPWIYSSCKQILEMDTALIDSDALGLTFVREVEELGSMKLVELCPGGKNIVVNSKNREKYVDLLIEHRFVTSISEQVSHFAKGFADILSNAKLQKFFFQSLEHEDLDRMLHGSESAICVEDWKAHTEYHGYKETDPLMSWFWQIIGEMSAEQKRVLLFFWTSIKYLPVEGFRGLASRLYIYKSPEPPEHLPSSHTCFYRLCFPPYASMDVARDRLHVITQEHVGCSFGTW